MSLSDKHEGKILVPWFCSQEWKHVYQLIYSENSNYNTKREALEILKIWKTRQVLLSSGVEGTLIILSALLVDTKHLDEENVCLLYATSVMRFLNLCAANNKKQGTFYETARKNNLPDWLINIRHDLAHDQKVPSKFMLQYCLNYCLDWLKREYWDVQYSIIRDCIALNKIGKKPHIEKYILLYEDIIQDVIKRKADTLSQLTSDAVEKLYSWFTSNNLNDHSSISYILILLSKAIVPAVSENRRDEFSDYLANELTKRGIIFEIPDKDFNVAQDEMHIPDKFLQLWLPLIRRIFKYKMFLTFMRFLNKTVTDGKVDFKTRKSAAVWLNSLFKVLWQMQNTENVDNMTNNFQLNEFHTIWEDLKKFQNEVLAFPNAFTLIFIERLLTLNKCTSEYVSAIKTLLKSYTQANSTKLPPEGNIHTVTELASKLSTFDIKNEVNEINGKNFQTNLNNSSKRWCLIEDTSGFSGCPLGVLPNQKRTRNPLL